MRPYSIGTRGSALALAQATWVQQELKKHHPNTLFELKVIKTRGDQLQSADSSPISLDKGLFTKELEISLLAKEIDFAVHSLKDLPTEISPDFSIAAIPLRANPFDILITRENFGFTDLPQHALIATGSPRRQKELLRLRPDLTFLTIRGNIDSRLKKLRQQKDWHGIILAAAGLERLHLYLNDLFISELSPEIMLPAPGQGALAIQTRFEDSIAQKFVMALEDNKTRLCVETERQFLAGLGGGCRFPLGAYATYEPDQINFEARFYDFAQRCHNFKMSFPFKVATKMSFEQAKNYKI